MQVTYFMLVMTSVFWYNVHSAVVLAKQIIFLKIYKKILKILTSNLVTKMLWPAVTWCKSSFVKIGEVIHLYISYCS